MVKAPDPIRTRKLSTIGPAQYCGGGPRGNRRWRTFFPFSFTLDHRFEPSFEPVGIALCCSYKCAIGLVVKYFVANEVPRVRFPDGAFLLSWRSWQRVGLIIPRSPVRSRSKAYVLPDSLGGQDTRLSPERPGFNSRSGNTFFFVNAMGI